MSRHDFSHWMIIILKEVFCFSNIMSHSKLFHEWTAANQTLILMCTDWFHLLIITAPWNCDAAVQLCWSKNGRLAQLLQRLGPYWSFGLMPCFKPAAKSRGVDTAAKLQNKPCLRLCGPLPSSTILTYSGSLHYIYEEELTVMVIKILQRTSINENILVAPKN